MTKLQIVTAQIFDLLNEGVNYAVLRNFEDLPLENSGRDIDILVDRSSFNDIRCKLISCFEEYGVKIVSYYRVERESFTLAINEADNIALLQLDFLFNCEVKGLLLIEAPIMLKSRIFNGKIYHVSEEHEFLAKYLYNKLLNESYPEKYIKLKEKFIGSDLLDKQIHEIFGFSLSELDGTPGKGLYSKKLIRNMAFMPVRQIRHIFRIIYLKMRHCFEPSMFSLGFTGPDGAGKTTVITEVVKVFDQVSKVQLEHFRPSIIPNIGDVAMDLGVVKELDRDYSKPHRSKKVGKLNSIVRLMYYSIDYVLGWFIKIAPSLKRSKYVIFDRYYTDIITDSKRSRISINAKFLYYFGTIFIPSLDYNFLINADPNIILKRKQELTKKGIEEINDKLGYLAKKKNYYLIKNNGRPEEAVAKILNLIFTKQHKDFMKRLG